MRISDWSSDVCSSDLHLAAGPELHRGRVDRGGGGAVRGRAEDAATGHADQPDASVRVVHPGGGGDDPVRIPAPDRRRPDVRTAADAELGRATCRESVWQAG